MGKDLSLLAKFDGVTAGYYSKSVFMFLNSNFYRDTFKNFIENLHIYKKISCETTFKVDANVVSIIKDKQFIDKVKLQLLMLEPICALINICQKVNVSVSEGAEAWMKIKFPSGCSKQQKNNLVNRKQMALTSLALGAFYLDPFKDKSLMTQNQRQSARSFVSGKLAENVKDQLIQYEKCSENFDLIRNSTRSAIDFWTFASAFYPELSTLALKLLKIPASTAQLERCFSMWQHVHSKLRNRLTFERSKTLMQCYYYFAMQNTEPQVVLENIL